MIDLNSVEEIKKLDPKDVFGSTEMFADQCEQIWEDAKKIEFDSYKSVENIVFCGMGGSAYGGYIINSLLKDQLSVPIISNNDYSLPAFVNDKSLVLLSSYSGGTEETLSCKDQAVNRGAKLTGITSGGVLAQTFKSNNTPALIFDPKFNPCGQPRLGTGYMILGSIALLNRMGLVSISEIGRASCRERV